MLPLRRRLHMVPAGCCPDRPALLQRLGEKPTRLRAEIRDYPYGGF